MKKHLYLIGGTMGVGKTTVCRILKKRLDRSVFLDGDWCWNMSPFVVTEETKTMVLDNITHLLNNFLSCSEYRHVIFCWVMHEQGIIDEIMSRLSADDCETHLISLVCDAEHLTARLQKDVDAGLRTEDVISRSTARLPLYDALRTVKLDTTSLSPEEASDRILALTAED